MTWKPEPLEVREVAQRVIGETLFRGDNAAVYKDLVIRVEKEITDLVWKAVNAYERRRYRRQEVSISVEGAVTAWVKALNITSHEWGRFGRVEWQDEVVGENTQLGYREWVCHQVEDQRAEKDHEEQIAGFCAAASSDNES